MPKFSFKRTISDILMKNEDEKSESLQEPPIKRIKCEQLKWYTGHYSPIIHRFDESSSGIRPNINVNRKSQDLDFFEMFIPHSIIRMIVTETNKYANSLKDNAINKSKMTKWIDTTVEEMYVFIATILLLTLVGKSCLKKYWSNNKVIETPFFKMLFSQDRFFLLLRCLHFSNNKATKKDKLAKIRNILEETKQNYKAVFYPYQNLAIVESPFMWKGKIADLCLQPNTFQSKIKVFVCCDIKTGFVFDIIIFTGSDTDVLIQENLSVSASAVASTLNDYLGKGHSLYLNDWCTSPNLLEYLHKNKTNACGIAKVNRKNMPNFTNEQMKKGETENYHCENILAIKWMDIKEIIMLTTMHDNSMKEMGKINYLTGQYKIKPSAVIDYTDHMGTVNKLERALNSSESSRKTFKWYKKLFFKILDISTLNAFYLYRQITKKKSLSFSEFKENIIAQIVEKYHTARRSVSRGQRGSDCLVRLTERHFPHPVPQTRAVGSRTRRKCHVCSHTKKRQKRRKDTKYMCTICEVSLCVYPCFMEYHTEKQY